MIFIGQNNHGKSNILTSLLFFFGEISLDSQDFAKGSDELFVEVDFIGLDEADNTTFRKYLRSDGGIRVRKVGRKDTGFSYHGYVETPTEPWLQADRATEYAKRETVASLPLAEYVPSSGRITKDNIIEAQNRYIDNHHAELSFMYALEYGPFLGAKNVAKGIFGDVYFVPSVKKAADEFSPKGKTVFGELYARVINKMSETNPEFREAKAKITDLMCILNRINADGSANSARPTELTSFEESLKSELSLWNTAVDVEIIPPEIDEIFKVGATVWVDDGIRTDVSRKGQGLQRALIFALVRSLAGLTREDAPLTASSSESEPSGRQTSRSTYFILEEPELYLHPQAQRELFESLAHLVGGGSQVVICTHSSAFVSLDHYKSICIVRKTSVSEGTTAFQCTAELFSSLDDRQKFNMAYWINPDRGELFFARKVILVEGATDKTVLPLLALRLGVFKHEYSVIDCGSKDSIPAYIQLLNGFRIPYVAVYDRDHQAHKDSNAVAQADAASARVTANVNPEHGVAIALENDIEEELGVLDKSQKHKPYLSLAWIERPEFSISQQLESKIRRIYQ